MPSRMTKHYALYMKIFTYPSTRLFTGSSNLYLSGLIFVILVELSTIYSKNFLQQLMLCRYSGVLDIKGAADHTQVKRFLFLLWPDSKIPVTHGYKNTACFFQHGFMCFHGKYFQRTCKAA